MLFIHTIVITFIIASFFAISMPYYDDHLQHLISLPPLDVQFVLAEEKMSSSIVHISNNSTDKTTMLDKFGIKEIYATKQHGREWYVNMTNPKVRMNVETPTGMQPWKNVEITGYAKVISVKSSKNNSDNNKSSSSNQDYSQTLEDIAWY